MPELILHHYAGSPYAEKIRLILGFKKLQYKSVSIPVTLPRPLLMPLTGGHRRTPVLQVGADIYCDTRRIAALLEVVQPNPTLLPPGSAALSEALSGWVEHRVFNATSPARFQSPDDVNGAFGGAVDVATFASDRQPYMERPYDMGTFLSLVPAALDQMHSFLGFLDRCLADGRPFLTGDAPSLADFAGYPSVWRLLEPPSRADQVANFPRVLEWAERVDAFGHGASEESSAEDALQVALSTKPMAVDLAYFVDPAGRKRGDRVVVRPDDTGRDPAMRGVLVGASEEEVTVLHENAEVGEVAVHFPCLGFEVLLDTEPARFLAVD